MRLRTIGGLWIEGEGSASLGPRPLALLALVAAAGKKGISRDRVVGILWPETSEEQARHALSQTLYRLRRETGREWIVVTHELRLEPSVSSDVGDLRHAVSVGELETVGLLYTGKFLDGFYLPAAPEFERWVEEERASLELEALRAIERLAQHADAEGRPAESVHWWQRLAELDPLSARYAAGHMRALAEVGDRSKALARAKSYREAVHRELNAEPDPAVQKLEQFLRAAPDEPTPVQPAHPLPPHPIPSQPEPAPQQSGTRRARWLVPAMLLGLVAMGLAVRSFGRGSAAAPPFLAVGEIRTDGSTDSISLGRILRDMLATSLGGIEGLQVVANSRLVELMPRGADTAPGVTHDAARRAGATEVIEGEFARETTGLVLSFRRVALPRGVVRKGYVIRAADRYAIVDSAAAVIARDLHLTPPSAAVTQIRTSSPGAYALYEEGLRAYFGYDAPAAYRLMTAALARDSDFAMAAYYAWQLSRSLADEATSTRALHRADRLALRTIERERLLIQASVAELQAPLLNALAIAETLTVKYPMDPEGQILLGLVRRRQGDWAGAVAAYERAFSLDSLAGALAGPYCRVCATLGLMSQDYLWWDSAGAAERVARRLIALRPNDGPAWQNLIEPLLRQGRRAEAEDAFVKLAGFSAAGAWSGPHMNRDLLRWGRYEEADRRLVEEVGSRSPEIRSDAWWLLLLSLRDQGRLAEADTLIHRRRVPNTSRLVLELGPDPIDLVMLGIEAGRPTVSARAFREAADRIAHSDMPAGLRARNVTWNLVLAGTAHAAAGDAAVVRRLADSLEALGPGSMFGRDAKLHYVLRGLLLQREGRHADAVDAFRRSLFSLTDGYTRTNLMMARSLLALGRSPEAIGVLRPALHGGVDGSNTYVSRTELHEALAEAFEQAGQRDSAVVHWRAVESAWRRADPRFRDRYLRARLKAGL